ncbi:MAG: hypothetical protein GF416_01345 [Candidatus Altiarchaeales archaeon]|nr:hypothetical protein [Candidatus Altiarchaeales archaeon]MBD3415761.1 hypothetical protein [Candidatus Altiarchaeales archaeon]
MRWSYSIFKVKGISIELHLLFIVWFMFILVGLGIQGFLFFSLIFTIVLAHELVHSLTAMMHGVKVPKITLLPIGGVASIELPDDPVVELRVAVVGPMFNFMLAAVGLLLIFALNLDFIGYDEVTSGIVDGSFAMDSLSGIVSIIVSLNLILGAFNMLPAFPMDGGRVFRSTLALWMDYTRATRIATAVGQFIFLTIAFLGLLSWNIWWIAIGGLLYLAGGSELKYISLRRALKGARLRDIAVQDIRYVNDGLTWREFLNTTFRRGENLYVKVDSDGVMRGVLDIRALKKVDPESRIGEEDGLDFLVLDGDLRVDESLKLLLGKTLVLVSDRNKLLGYITQDSLADATVFFALTGEQRL